MALSPKTVAYQETSNNYTDTRQQIKGIQIASVKVFGLSPSGSGDYQGQFGIANPVPAITNFYVWSGTEWAHVASSDTTSLPDTVVQENIDNNFTHPNQRIMDCPITYLDRGAAAPTTGMIKGPGHVYVQEVNPTKVFMTVDGMDWIQLRTHDDTGDYVVRDQANDFTNNDQTINARPILAAIQHTVDPTVAGIVPERLGQVFIQLAEGTADRRARMWIANPDGGMHWEEVVAPVATMVRTDTDNNFAVVEQKLNGNQILSFIDGGDQTPEQSKLKPDYDGQAYIAVRTLVGGDKSVGVWIANGNAWLPILEDTLASTIVRKDQSNIFAVHEQFLGANTEARQITGARVKYGGLAPAADSTWRTTVVGEITVWQNDSTTPAQYSVWVSVLKNPSTTTNSGEWQMLWSSVDGAGSQYARKGESNVFAPMQYINDGKENHLISVGREGGNMTPRDAGIVPMSAGEFYTQTMGVGVSSQAWVAGHEGDTDSWHRIHTDLDKTVVLTTQSNTFLNNEQFMTGAGGKKSRVGGVKMAKPTGTGSWTGPAPGLITPSAFGEIVICEEYEDNLNPASEVMIVAYLACGVSNDNWIEIGRKPKGIMVTGDPSNPQ